MTKQDLKTGMLVQCVNGNVYLVVHDSFIREKGQTILGSFAHTLECLNDENFNIVRVSKVLKAPNLRPSQWTEETVDKYLLWSRDSGLEDSEKSEKPPRKEEFDIETNTWTETKETS